jgi:hypothetical protein
MGKTRLFTAMANREHKDRASSMEQSRRDHEVAGEFGSRYIRLGEASGFSRDVVLVRAC